MDVEEATPPTGAPSPGRHRETAALLALTLPVLLISVDATILGFAIPAISEDLGPTSSQLLWIIDVYSFVLTGLLVTMGNLGDRVGRRRLLLIGAAGFSVASVLAAFASSTEALIAARAGLGVAGATLMPSTLSLIRNIFTDGRRRQFAIATWAAMFSVGAVLGPLVGGVLLEHFWWGSVFLVGVPVTLALLVVGPFVVPESRDPDPAPFDLPSAGLSMAAMFPLVYGMKRAAEGGVSTVTVAALAAGTAAGVAFVHRQRRLAVPMIDVALFRVGRFRAAIVANLVTCMGFAGSVYFLTQHLQLVAGLDPLRAAVQFLPGSVAAIVATFAAPGLGRRFGPFRVIVVGVTVGAVGFALLAVGAGTDGLTLLTFGHVVLEAGLCAAITVAIDGIMTSIPPAKAGAGASISETANELGVALGTAVLGSIATVVYRDRLAAADLPASSLAGAEETLGSAHAAAADLAGAAGDALLDAADAAFTAGFATAALVMAGLLALVGVWTRAVARR